MRYEVFILTSIELASKGQEAVWLYIQDYDTGPSLRGHIIRDRCVMSRDCARNAPFQHLAHHPEKPFALNIQVANFYTGPICNEALRLR
jgi:hypothetical protein